MTEQNNHEAPPVSPLKLNRVLGLVEVTAGGIGIIIGAGIYVLVGSATSEAGAGVWLAFVLAAVLSFLTALSYMELTSMYPSSAGEYEYTRQVFPEWIAFSVGWLMIAGLVVAAAAISLGFARYVAYFVQLDSRLGAVALLCFVALVAASGIRQSARLTIILSIVQVGGLLFVIAIGIPHLGQHTVFQLNGFDGLLAAGALVFFAFIGFDEVITLAEETKNPTRTVPLALGLALGFSTVLYTAVAVASVSVLGVQALGSSEQPLAAVIEHAMGTRGGQVMAALAVISTTNTTLLAVTASSRLLYGMAARGSLPSKLAVLNPLRRTPVNAILLTVAVAAAFTMFHDLRLVASTTDFAIYCVFLAVNGSVIALRFKASERPRPFRTPGSLAGVPLTPLLALFSVIIMVTQLEPTAITLGSALLCTGPLAYLSLRYAKQR